jgi:hypothetical protein
MLAPVRLGLPAGRFGVASRQADRSGPAQAQAGRCSMRAGCRAPPVGGITYTTLMLWFAEGVHRTAIASPPLRPWYSRRAVLR